MGFLDEFFDDIVVNAKSAANTVGKKANQIKDYSKLKYSESGIKSEIAKKKQELGNYIYNCSKTGDIDKIVMQGFVAEIDELEENLQITREMLTIAKNKIICKYCKAENDRESVFCCKCGSKLDKEEKAEECCCCGNNEEVTVAASPSVEDTNTDESDNLTISEKDTVSIDKSADVIVEEVKEEAAVEEAKKDNIVEDSEE